MPCFCCTPADALTALAPPEPLRIRAIPPQLSQLADILALDDPGSGARADMTLAQALPDMGAEAWMRATMQASAPSMTLPRRLPMGAGPLVSAVMKLGLQGSMFPFAQPDRLIAAIRQTLVSFAAGPLPAAAPLMAMKTPQFDRLTAAARLTLALRAQGLCPLALAGVDGQFVVAESLGDPRAAYTSAMHLAVDLSQAPIQPFAMSSDQVALAGQFAAMAGMDTMHEPLGLPPANTAGFPSAAMELLNDLASIPMPRLPMSPAAMLDLAGVLEATATIQRAFGDDALTPAGTARINAMLSYVARLSLPDAGAALAMQGQVDMLAPFETIQSGATVARACGATLAASMTAAPPDLPMGPALDGMSALGAVMEHALGRSPFCADDGDCDFPIDSFLPARPVAT